jgi:hypothetical protein
MHWKWWEEEEPAPDLVRSNPVELRIDGTAFAAGAGGYILEGDAREIPGAIRQILRGDRYVSPGLQR